MAKQKKVLTPEQEKEKARLARNRASLLRARQTGQWWYRYETNWGPVTLAKVPTRNGEWS